MTPPESSTGRSDIIPFETNSTLQARPPDGVGHWKALYAAAMAQVIDGFIKMQTRLGMPEEHEFQWRMVAEEVLNNSLVHGNLETSSELRRMDGDVFFQHLRSITERSVLERPLHLSTAIEIENIGAESRDNPVIKAILRVQDQGKGFDPDAVPDPTLEENLEQTTGRGITLIKAFTDEHEYTDGGRTLTLAKKFPYRDPTAAESKESA